MRRLPGPQGLLASTALALLGLWLNAAVAFADGPGVPSVGSAGHISSTASQAVKTATTTAHAAATTATATASTASATANQATTIATSVSTTARSAVHQATPSVSSASKSIAPQPPSADQPHKSSDAPKPPKPVTQITETARPLATVAQSVAEQAAPIAETVETTTRPVSPIVQTVDNLAEPISPIVQTIDNLADPLQPVAAPIVQTVDDLAGPLEPVVESVEPVAESVEPVAEVAQTVVEPIAPRAQPIVQASLAPQSPNDSMAPAQSDASGGADVAPTADETDDPTANELAAPTAVDDAPFGLTNSSDLRIEVAAAAPDGKAPDTVAWQANVSQRATTTQQATNPRQVEVAPSINEAVAGARDGKPQPTTTVDSSSPASSEFGGLTQPINIAPIGQNRFGGLATLGGDSLRLAPPELPGAAPGGSLVSGAGGAGAAVFVAAALVLLAAWRTLWQVARLRPVGITLPNLAPPG